MKRFVVFTVLIYFASVWGVLAQNKPISSPLAKQTPIQVSGRRTSNFPSHGSSKSPNVHGVNIIVRNQQLQIQKDFKTGKITKEQAQTAWENLKNVRKQELEFFRENGQKEITDYQKSQLNKVLNDNLNTL